MALTSQADTKAVRSDRAADRVAHTALTLIVHLKTGGNPHA